MSYEIDSITEDTACFICEGKIKQLDTIGKLAERDGAITCYNEVLAELREENAALRAEVERLNNMLLYHDNTSMEDTAMACRRARQEAAQEIIEDVIGDWNCECGYGGLVIADAIKAKFGLEGVRDANRQLAGAAICPDHLKPENIRKQTAAEILDLLTQEEIRRITSVGDPRVTTISSKLLAMMTELRQRYGLEG